MHIFSIKNILIKELVNTGVLTLQETLKKNDCVNYRHR